MYFEDEILDDYDEEYEEREVNFIVNAPRITAIESGHAFDGAQLIMKRYPWVDPDWLADNFKRFAVADEVKVIVKCTDGDTFSEEEGRRQALKKLNQKIINHREWAVTEFEKYIKNQMAHPCAKKKVTKYVYKPNAKNSTI